MFCVRVSAGDMGENSGDWGEKVEKMMLPEEIQKKLDERNARAASRGFTHEYQNAREQEDNTISHKQLAPATLRNYENTALNWTLWRLSCNEAANANFSREEPDPTPQLLKSFAEYYIATRKKLPSQKSACLNFINFTSRWERETCRTLPGPVKEDVLNHLTFNIKWGSKDGKIKCWVTIDPEFLKGQCYIDDRYLPKNWFRENPILGFNFVFWIIVQGVADGAFKGLRTVEDILAVIPPKGRESYTLE
ncbi:hypothetical protein N7450_001752 [Penicillium hetheringtonii]|uniref:Uncharacterized protein n=1 Tax=Penicillium hetheringtonii TaxID=911720 RepID=A0AAD6E617_9EURO|nr:hypothetical protein N7450_001752 [Penicillium hetheringtonii]